MTVFKTTNKEPIKCYNACILFFLISLTYYLPSVESYVYAPYDLPSEAAYESEPSINTIPYSEQEGGLQTSLLFLAPPMNRQLCNTNIPNTKQLIQFLFDNYMVNNIYPVYDYSTTDYLMDTDINRISLLVERGGCTFEEKGKNALEINRSLGLLQSNGTSIPRIEELIIYNDSTSNECERISCNINFDTDGNDRMSLWSVFITRGSYESIQSKLFAKVMNDNSDHGINRHRHPYLTRNAFKLHETSVNDFQYYVRVDGLPPGGDSTGGFPTRGFIFWLYVFIAIAVLVPIAKYFIFFIFINYTCRFRRDETTNRITGIIIERTYIPDVQDQNEIDLGRRNLRRRHFSLMTEDEINNLLPTVEFGISNIRDILKDTHNTDAFEDYQTNNDTYQDAYTANVINSEIGGSKSEDISSSSESPLSSQQKLIITAYESSTVCSICMEDFEHGEKLKLLPRCGHIFHKDCIKPWLCQRKKNCVLCQKPVVVGHFPNEPDLLSITPVVPPQQQEEL